MSVKKSIDKTLTALEKKKTKMVKTCEYLKGLTVKNRARVDIQLKSDKVPFPTYKRSFAWCKEVRVVPLVLSIVTILFMMIFSVTKRRK